MVKKGHGFRNLLPPIIQEQFDIVLHPQHTCTPRKRRDEREATQTVTGRSIYTRIRVFRVKPSKTPVEVASITLSEVSSMLLELFSRRASVLRIERFAFRSIAQGKTWWRVTGDQKIGRVLCTVDNEQRCSLKHGAIHKGFLWS